MNKYKQFYNKMSNYTVLRNIICILAVFNNNKQYFICLN